MEVFVRLALLAWLFQSVIAYKPYQNRIPNGHQIPYPCKNQIWEGVGHFLPDGTGHRNLFGEDFAKAGHSWTEELCQKDSDGDGVTNGQEIGDPNCVWKENAIPTRSDGLTHPGICDPWDNPTCLQRPQSHPTYKTQKEWLEAMCKSNDFKCDGITEPGMRNLSVRLKPTSVPAKVTTYMCQIFNLSQEGMIDGDHHMIAVQPIIDNRAVLHHMVLSGCEDDTELTDGSYECGMLASQKCRDFLHVWTVGLNGECYHPESGIRIGIGGYKKVAIQLHWTNIEKSNTLNDSSGLLLYYTPERRTHDAAVLMIGNTYFYMPPRQPAVSVNSTCSSTCTSNLMAGKVQITTAWNHMHYLGRKMNIELRRNKNHVTYLTYDQVYSYDSPVVHSYIDDPVLLYPGDELITSCGFNTTERNRTIWFGEATEDEMCLGFLTYYPKKNFSAPFCVDDDGLSECDPSTYEGCDLSTFLANLPFSNVFSELVSNCKKFSPCQLECKESILKYMASEPCMKSKKVWSLLQGRYLHFEPQGGEFLAYLASCKTEVYLAMNPQTETEEANPGNSASSLMTTSTILGVMVLALVSAFM